MNNTIKNFQEKEIWKEIQGYEGLYAVSSKGNVRNIRTGRLLGGGYYGNGYPFVILYKANSKPKQINVHRLVALAFIPNPYNLPYINHKNEIKDDNEVSNLEWCSASYNTNYSIHKRYRKVRQLTKDGKLIRIWESSWQINRETGYDASSIIKCCRGKYKQAYGFKWEYADPSQQHKYNRPVAALTKEGEFVAKYKSAAEASRCLNICVQSIIDCLNGNYKSTHGFMFIDID